MKKKKQTSIKALLIVLPLVLVTLVVFAEDYYSIWTKNAGMVKKAGSEIDNVKVEDNAINFYQDGTLLKYTNTLVNVDSITFTTNPLRAYPDGIPHAPGIVEAEHFDLGGEGVAYHDDSPGNAGGDFRTDEDVDIENIASPANGNYNIGWINAGEWLKYTINAPEAGTYHFNFYMKVGENAHFNLVIDEEDPITVLKPASWASYDRSSGPDVVLSAGNHVVTVQFTEPVNFDKFEFYIVPPAADLLDVVFNSDGTATDRSPNHYPVTTLPGASLTTFYNEPYQCYTARFTPGTVGSNMSSGFYTVDYKDNAEFKNKLSDGFTMESVFMLDVPSPLPNAEIKPFASQGGGGMGFLVANNGHGNEITFLPNVSTGGNNWVWATSGIVPQQGVYYHVVGVWDKTANEAKIYVNGILKKTVATNGNLLFPSTANNHWFGIGVDAGQSATSGEGAWKGDIAVARIYDNPLTAEEIAQLWNWNKNLPWGNGIGITNISYPSGVTVLENSDYTIQGIGFIEGDKIKLISQSEEETFVCDGTATASNITITLPEEMTSGQYQLIVVRGDKTQVLGLTTLTITTPHPTPYPDGITPHAPGIVEAEHFDLGGEGIAYHDDSPGNAGGDFRTDEDVDIENIEDPSNGNYDIGWINAGEWLKYTINAPEAGTYHFNFYMKTGEDSSFELVIDEEEAITVPKPSSWWGYPRSEGPDVVLSAGNHVVTVRFTSGMNFDKFEFYFVPPAADLLDVVFNSDGTATDRSPNHYPITTLPGASLSTVYSDQYHCYTARFNPSTVGGNIGSGFYNMDYKDNTEFKNKLSDGFTMESVFMLNVASPLPNAEIKPFASHGGGGMGLMVANNGHGNEITFLPNVSTGGSNWVWATSGIVPQQGVYYHVVGVWDKTANEAKIYVNGILKNTVATNGNLLFPSTANNHWFGIGVDAGESATAGQGTWKGDVVVARIYDNPLTTEEVEQMWNRYNQE